MKRPFLWICFLFLPALAFGQSKSWPLDRESVSVVEKVTPSIVTIYTIPPSETEVVPDLRKHNYGTGVIVDSRGLILTSSELVRGKVRIVVFLHDGTKYFARRIGRDTRLGIALLSIPAKNLRPITFADTKKVRVGQLVFKFGNAFQTAKDYRPAVNFGTLSSIDKVGSFHLFRTDSGINRGDFGGALVDIHGRLVGILIPSWVHPGTNTYVSYAVPTHLFSSKLDSMKGYVGILLTISSQKTNGALIEAVDPEGPAARAGLRTGDYIVRFGKATIESTEQLAQELSKYTAGERVAIVVRRGGKLLRLTLTLGEKVLD